VTLTLAAVQTQITVSADDSETVGAERQPLRGDASLGIGLEILPNLGRRAGQLHCALHRQARGISHRET